MNDSSVVTDPPANDLASFQAAQAEALTLRVTGRPGVDTVQIITYSEGTFTLGRRAVRPGIMVPMVLQVLDPQDLSALLSALQDEVDHPPKDLTPDMAALRAFIEVLAGKVGAAASNLFEQARFAGITKDACDAIVAHLGLGIDTAGTLYDAGGTVSFSTHVIPLPPGPFQPLSQPDRDSLVAALTTYLDNTPQADPLWRELLNDLREGMI